MSECIRFSLSAVGFIRQSVGVFVRISGYSAFLLLFIFIFHSLRTLFFRRKVLRPPDNRFSATATTLKTRASGVARAKGKEYYTRRGRTPLGGGTRVAIRFGSIISAALVAGGTEAAAAVVVFLAN